MQATIKKIGQQAAREYRYPNGAHVLFSYATPVGAYIPGLGWLETERKYSRTTSKHVTQWLRRQGYPYTQKATETELVQQYHFLDSLIWEDAA